jgi:hypothetical protein
MDKELFEQETKARRKKDVHELGTQVLAKMLKQDVRMFDTHYIRDRVVQITEQTVKKLKFKNEEIERARRAFMDVLIDGMQENMFDVNDEIKAAKKLIKSKDKEKRRKAVENLSRLERIRDHKPKEATEERDVECEPVCQFIAKQLLSKDWLLKNDDYVKGVIELDNELLILVNAMQYVSAVFEVLYDALDQSYLRANEKNWGCSREKIRLSQLDNRLKE